MCVVPFSSSPLRGMKPFGACEPPKHEKRSGRCTTLRCDVRIRFGKEGEWLALKSQPQSLDALFHEELRSEDRVIAFAVLEKVEIDRSLPHHQNIHFRTRAALLRHLVEKHVNGAVVGKRLCWHL